MFYIHLWEFTEFPRWEDHKIIITVFINNAPFAKGYKAPGIITARLKDRQIDRLY